jgi:hypothetical protein
MSLSLLPSSLVWEKDEVVPEMPYLKTTLCRDLSQIISALPQIELSQVNAFHSRVKQQFARARSKLTSTSLRSPSDPLAARQ